MPVDVCKGTSTPIGEKTNALAPGSAENTLRPMFVESLENKHHSPGKEGGKCSVEESNTLPSG